MALSPAPPFGRVPVRRGYPEGSLYVVVPGPLRPGASNEALLHHLRGMKLTPRTDTEIFWRSYMQQVEQYRNGERDYTLIKGDTGWTPKCTLRFFFLGAESGGQVHWSIRLPICSYITVYTL